MKTETRVKLKLEIVKKWVIGTYFSFRYEDFEK